MLQMPIVKLGTDPEAFLRKGPEIIGSERVVPAEGLKGRGGVSIVRDGVQLELTVRAATFRDLVARDIGTAFERLKEEIADFEGVEVDFDPVVAISKEELDSLSECSRIFGCQPSYNYYGLEKPDIDGSKYYFRSAGGHIHLGLSIPIFDNGKYTVVGKLENGMEDRRYEIDKRKRLVPILDALVGNTSVMIDRHPLVVERRKLYGMAGEYRLPYHGLEYRTLSNFWLQSYQLMSLMFGLAKMAVGVLHTELVYNDGTEEKLWKLVDQDAVRDAIHNNDLKLAHQNWEGVKAFIKDQVHYTGGFGISSYNVEKFELFLKGVLDHGLDHWFPEPQLEHWIRMSKHPNLDTLGFEEFLRDMVF